MHPRHGIPGPAGAEKQFGFNRLLLYGSESIASVIDSILRIAIDVRSFAFLLNLFMQPAATCHGKP
jgi:hypothetical protein